jgi:ABC-type polysaccharide/polyol phosphate export permease
LSTTTDSFENPPADLLYRHRVHIFSSLTELWRARGLVRTLAERDFRARYKQAALGFAWAVFTPLVLMIVFSVFFQKIARIDTEGAPYPLFSYLGILPWSFFSSALSTGGMSIVTNKALLNKVYFPREVFPLASVGIAGIDTSISALMLIILFARYGFAPGPEVLWIPLMFAIQVAFTLGAVLIVSAVLVYARDLRHALPIILQLGLFATPVAYRFDQIIPESLRTVYAALNPLAVVIDGYRRSTLYGAAPDVGLLAIGGFSALLVLAGGYVLFKRLETRFADVA